MLDIYPGNSSGISSSGSLGFPTIITNPAAAFAAFAANDGVHGNELWFSSDGTAGGTYMVKDIEAGAASSDPTGLTFFPTLNLVFFSAKTAAAGREPYYSNAALGNAPLLQNISAGASSSDPFGFALSTSGNRIVFGADDGTHGKELWQTDIATTSLVSDLNPGSSDSPLLELTQMPSGKVMFTSIVPSASGIAFKQYLTNGTPGGTVEFNTLSCLPGGVFSLFTQGLLRITSVVNGHAVFPCQKFSFNYIDEIDALNFDTWVSDGTVVTTKQLKDIFPGEQPSNSFGQFRVNGGLVIPANDGIHGIEPWFTDGTEAGTHSIADLNTGEASAFNQDFAIFSLLQNSNSSASASLLSLTVGKRQKFFYTDGTLANTRELFDDSSDATIDSDPSEFSAVGPLTVFSALHTSKGRELFVTDGHKSGTKLLKNIFKSGDSNPKDFIKLSPGKALFSAADQAHGRELWITDGTKPGSHIVKDIQAGVPSSQPIMLGVKLKGKIFFSADDGTNGKELWVSKGTRKGTKLLKDINPGSGASNPSDAAVFMHQVFFQASDETNGSELWVSDGTSAGTTLFEDIYPGNLSSSPENLTVVGDKLFFSASTAAAGQELWVSDGTPAGTHQVKDIYVGAAGSSPYNFTTANGILFFVALDATHGQELWRSDGTETGTFMVEDINPGASSSQIEQITALPNNRVVFSAYDMTHGYEIWGAGEAAGSASMLKDINANAASSYPGDLYFIANKSVVIFSATSASEGSEIWTTDGTEAGTSLFADLVPGADGSSPGSFFVRGKKLFFAANMNKTGQEPYIMRLP